MSMSYDSYHKMLNEMEKRGTEPKRVDFFRMLQHHEEERRKKQIEMEKRQNEKRNLYNQIEAEDQMKADRQKQREQLMATSKFNVASILPQVKSLVADKQFEASDNASQSVFGANTISVEGGRRTRRHKRSDKKRSNKKRSNKKRSNKKRSNNKKW